MAALELTAIELCQKLVKLLKDIQSSQIETILGPDSACRIHLENARTVLSEVLKVQRAGPEQENIEAKIESHHQHYVKEAGRKHLTFSSPRATMPIAPAPPAEGNTGDKARQFRQQPPPVAVARLQTFSHARKKKGTAAVSHSEVPHIGHASAGTTNQGKRRGNAVVNRPEEKLITLIAVLQRTDLGLDGSSTTAMMAICGRRFGTWYQKREKLMTNLMWLSVLGYLTALYLPAFASAKVLQGLLMIGSMGWTCFHFLSMLNWRIVLLTLQMFDTWFFLLYSFVPMVALWFIDCHDPTLAVANLLSTFATVVVYVFYDAMPLSKRRRVRYLLLAGVMLGILQMYHRYRDFPPPCNYYFDFSRGIFLPEDVDCATGKGIEETKKWSMSLADFFTQTSQTTLLLMLKIVFLAFRFPDCCIMLRYRVKLVETERARMPGERVQQRPS